MLVNTSRVPSHVTEVYPLSRMYFDAGILESTEVKYRLKYTERSESWSHIYSTLSGVQDNKNVSVTALHSNTLSMSLSTCNIRVTYTGFRWLVWRFIFEWRHITSLQWVTKSHFFLKETKLPSKLLAKWPPHGSITMDGIRYEWICVRPVAKSW
jgi:hypothetical protein